jgi:hypothetical protein
LRRIWTRHIVYHRQLSAGLALRWTFAQSDCAICAYRFTISISECPVRIAHEFFGRPGEEVDQLRLRNRGKWWIVGAELRQLLARAVVVGDGMLAAADGFFVMDEVGDRLR